MLASGLRPELNTSNFDILNSFDIDIDMNRRNRRLVRITSIKFPDKYVHSCQEFEYLWALIPLYFVLQVKDNMCNRVQQQRWNSFFSVCTVYQIQQESCEFAKKWSSFGVCGNDLPKRVGNKLITDVKMWNFGVLSFGLRLRPFLFLELRPLPS